MKTEDIKKMGLAFLQVLEGKKKLDPVDQDELKGSHADRKDKDIDNDGDADKSDEYLHNRRKAVSKAMKKESDNVVMNPVKKEKKNAGSGTSMESKRWPILARVLENRAAHYKNAAPAMDNEEGLSPSAKKVKADQEKAGYDKDANVAAADTAKAATDKVKKAPARNGDNQAGDKSIVKSGTQVKQ